MSLLQYGFQKLVLLNSAGYNLAELPLDASVSLIAPNNTGKTSLINALQFLLILDKRNMDFGAYTPEVSRKFYFPDNCSYILLEVLLPTTGMAVIGCVGKGLAHDYEYFAYKGNLDTADYRLANGNLINQPKLLSHLIERGKLAKFYSQTDLKAMLYGNKQRLKNDDLDLTIFPLEMPSFSSTYQRVLMRTLRLDKLSSKEVKEYLLEIFKREVTDSSVDFKSEWDKAFADVNQDKAHFDAVNTMKTDIERLEKMQTRRKGLRGQLIKQRPFLEETLKNWHVYYQQQTAYLTKEREKIGQQRNELDQRVKTIVREQTQAESKEIELKKLEKQYTNLQFQFAGVKDSAQLENYQQSLQDKRDEIVTDIKQANQLSVNSIQRQINNQQEELQKCQRQLANCHDNFYLLLQQYLPPSVFQVISRLFSRDTLSLSANDKGKIQFYNEDNFKLLAEKLTRIIDNDSVQFAGLSIDTSGLHCELTLKNAEELTAEKNEIKRELARLTHLLATATALESKQQERLRLEGEIKKLDADIQCYNTLLTLENSKIQRHQQLEALAEQLATLKEEDRQFDNNRQQLQAELETIQTQQRDLTTRHNRIDNARNTRPDKIHSLDYLIKLPHNPSLLPFEPNMIELATLLENYNRDYTSLLKSDSDLNDGLHYLHTSGVTKFQHHDSAEQELESLFDFNAQLAQEKIAIDRKARSAVIQIAALLRELDSGLNSLKRCMNEFNKLINKRQLSDLKVFKVEAREDGLLVNAIKTLISTSEQLESGESFDLLNQHTVLDDKSIEEAKRLLIKEGETRGSLRIEHLFRLVFILAKDNQSAKEYDDIDSAASNGTVLMAKLITGLALLNLMQDNRKTIHTTCYLDEAASLDQHNQSNLITTAAEFGFALIFASPEAQITARYCVPIKTVKGKNQISRKDWQILAPL